MNFDQIDWFADKVNPLFAVALLISAIAVQKGSSWQFVLRVVIATLLCQQISKAVQKLHLFEHSVTASQISHGIKSQFPSSHFVVVLCIATAFYLLNKRFLWVSIAVPVIYGVVMLYQQYHTPLEMLGAFYAIPITWLCVTVGTQRKALSTEQNKGNVVAN